MSKQTYYEYNPDASGRWWSKETPSGKEKFQKSLTDLAGLNPFGKPIFRVEWAATLLHDITEVPQLKYKITCNTITHHKYFSTDGRMKKWYAGEAKPADLDPNEPVVAVREDKALGKLRWVIEKWESADDLRRHGRFVNLHDDSGTKVLRDLPSKGVYNHYFWVHTRDRKYRDLDGHVFTAIEAMHRYDITTSEAQKTLDAIEAESNQSLVGAKEASNIWAEMPH